MTVLACDGGKWLGAGLICSEAQVAVGLAVESYRRKKVMLFDPQTQQLREA